MLYIGIEKRTVARCKAQCNSIQLGVPQSEQVHMALYRFLVLPIAIDLDCLVGLIYGIISVLIQSRK